MSTLDSHLDSDPIFNHRDALDAAAEDVAAEDATAEVVAAEDATAKDVAAWEMIEAGRYRPRRIRGSNRGRELG